MAQKSILSFSTLFLTTVSIEHSDQDSDNKFILWVPSMSSQMIQFEFQYPPKKFHFIGFLFVAVVSERERER